ncbi:hypothetical protein [Paraburkholderia caffeinilytica]|uniref:hypothetical protein n=1 Tax=Paraburkholderia caffeinilytica TaxID=1761016 RepID=UPI003DA0091C
MWGMMQPDPVSRSCFTCPEVYVLVNEKAVAEPRLFHWLITDEFGDENAVRCFLSYADAALAAGIARATQGLVVAPAKAAQFGIEAFRVGDEYFASLHMGWGAHQGRLLVSEDGVFVTFGMPLRQPVSSPAPSFEVDDRALAMVGGLYESAGMFAWREMFTKMEWNGAGIRHALSGIEIEQWGVVKQDQYAFFNSESGEWHFLPLDGPEYETPELPAN